MSSRGWLAIAALVVAVPLLAGRAGAASVLVITRDGAGEGFNDPTPVAPVGGNRGTTLGEQRRIAFDYAAELWAARLLSPVQIRISATFDPLACGAASTTLGVAGPVSVFRDFAGAPRANTFYPSALADSLAGMDLAPDEDDIDATFNSVFGTTCPFPASWYYGLDGNAPGEDSDFVTVALHELGHGFGFITFVDVDTGERFQGRDDIFLTFLLDTASNETFDTMTNAQRRAAIEATGSLVWNGPAVVAASGVLTSGADGIGQVEIYAPPFAQAGSSASHWSDTLSPLELMKPFFEAPLHDVGLAAPALADVGWQLAGTSVCAGDCDVGGSVSIDELIIAVRIALGDSGGALCAAVDTNSDGIVSIDELVASVGRALDGCPAG
ncbi:MAG TPA: hypothetical protein VL049_23600 [Candidatus Dormibacteraeota bacterium]|nr:hypothetical protein [Candidatus Dormibacteraeota bacterium]